MTCRIPEGGCVESSGYHLVPITKEERYLWIRNGIFVFCGDDTAYPYMSRKRMYSLNRRNRTRKPDKQVSLVESA